VISDNQILAARINFACCEIDYLRSYVKALTFGDVSCAEEQRRKWLYMKWAARIMRSTRTSTETTGGCVTKEYANDVYCKAGCYCKCGCGPGYAPLEGTLCDPVPEHTVLEAVDVNQRAAIESGPPAEGDAYLVVANEDSLVDEWSVNTIQTWDGLGWVEQELANNQIVLAEDTGDFWITYNSTTPGLLFPALVVTASGPLGDYEIVSQYPATAATSGRTVYVSILINGMNATLYYGPESHFATPQEYSFGSAEVSSISVTYISGNCETIVVSEVEPPDPFCGTVDVDLTAEVNCDDQTFDVTVSISNPVDFPLGNIIPFVNDAAQTAVPAAVGDTVIGPFYATDTVSVRVTNTFSSECDVESDEIRSPQFPESDYTVLQAVDAAFEPSAQPGLPYLIVSNVDSLSGGWADHVCEIWSGTDYITVADGEVTLAADPGAPLGYWQMDSGTQVQVFGAPEVVYNTITLVYVVTPPPVSPFMAGVNVFVSYNCGGTPVPIYSGPVEGFAESFFTPACAPGTVEVTMTYVPTCPVTVDAVIESYTPDGDPDPDFTEGGLNNAVYSVVVDPDDRLIVGGLFTQYASTTANRFTRLNSDGTLDTTFNTALGTGFNDAVRSFVRESSGSYLIVGDFTSFDGTSVGRIARISEDGVLDTTFNTNIGTGFTFPAFSINDLGDGTYIVTGTFNAFNGSSHTGIIKIDADGNIVPEFVGNFSSQAGIASLNPVDGSIIVNNGFSLFYNGTNIAAGAGTGGSFVSIDTTTGALRSVIPLGTKFNSYALPTVMPDGSYIVAGQFTSYNGVTANRIIKLTATGVVDPVFATNVGTGFNDETTNVTVLPNGQIAICMVGTATTFNGNPTAQLVVMSQDGVRDFSFNTGTGFAGGRTLFLKYQSDGTLVAVGWFTSVDGLTRLRVARLQ